MRPYPGEPAVQLDTRQTACDDGSMMSERKDDNERREEESYARMTGQGAGEGVAEARESPITIEQYEGANTWGDLKGISVRKLAEGLVRIERRVAAIEGRMATKEDLEGMATKEDLAGMATTHELTKTKLSIVLWNAGVVLAGVALMAVVTFGIIQFALT